MALPAAAGLLRAQAKPSRGKQVVMDAVTALGGNAYLTMQNRVETGRAFAFHLDQISGLSVAKVYTRYLPPAAAPAELALRVREVFGKKGETSTLFLENGEAWDLTWRGARPLPQDEIERYRRSTLHNVFYILRERLNERGMTFDYQSQDVYEDEPVDIVDITDIRNDTTTVYFNQLTKLPMRQLYYWRDPEGRNTEITVYTKFRDVGGGVKWPFDVHRERNGEKIFEMFSDAVEINQDLKEGFFELPEGIKKLKPV
jgi:hypothetical protein